MKCHFPLGRSSFPARQAQRGITLLVVLVLLLNLMSIFLRARIARRMRG